MAVIEVLEYNDTQGCSPFRAWFDNLNAEAAAKVTTAITRLSLGNWSSTKGVGGGIFENRINFGPGYRIYFARDGNTLVILLGGGTKARQQQDICDAIERWQDYKRRKKAGKK